MRTMNFAGRALVAGLMTGVAGGALVVATPAAAQSAENCTVFAGGFVRCDEPNGDVDFVLPEDYAGIADGAYDNLDSKIEQTAPTEAETEAAQAELDAANEAAADLNDAATAVEASLTEDNLAAFDAVDTAEAGFTDALAVENDAADAFAAAQTAFDAAADDLTDANGVVTDASVALDNAQDAVDTAQAAYDADQTPENLAALNAALADRADAQQDLADAEASRLDALAAANAAADDLTAAQAVFDDAAAARLAAADDLADAITALDTSLASNDDFVDAITTAGFTADADGLVALNDSATAANELAAIEQAQFNALDDISNTFVRARDVLVPAAENQNAAIAAASQALLGDPRAAETNYEVEVVAALVDHEERITTNEATLVEHDQRIAANAAAIVEEAEIRALADAQLLDRITSEENARIAGDTALQNQITGLSTRVGNIETRLDDLDDAVASSTATAIALGGMGFLPDTKFNLAVSGGFYEGANAIAANVGIRVNDKVAITAGVGGGLNKGGKVGGRVGIIFGW